MKHLKELGVDVSKASAYWYRIFQDKGDGHIRIILDWKPTFSLNLAFCTGLNLEAINAFTLQDILDILPNKIYNDCYLHIEQHYLNGEVWDIYYMSIHAFVKMKMTTETNLIDAAYEMLCWCIEKGDVSTDK